MINHIGIMNCKSFLSSNSFILSMNKFSHMMLFFFLSVSCVSSLTFNLSSIGTNHAKIIDVQGCAYVSQQGIQVTTNEREPNCTYSGRATYNKTLHLYDKSSLTNFSTHFKFQIDSDTDSYHTDGLAFFLAPPGSTIPDNSSGSGLGLANNAPSGNSSGDPFVAVEFDTHTDPWDRRGNHVGIDINTVRSVALVSWKNNITEGKVTDAWIRYDSSTKNLSVEVTGFMNNTYSTSRLHHTVDLRKYLPDKVIVGFSGAPGRCLEKNNIQSWEFSSTLIGTQSGKRMTTGIQVGLVVLAVTVCIVLPLGYIIQKKIIRKDKMDEIHLNMTMDNEFEKGSGPKRFSYGELTRSTGNFAEDEKLGEGGFGSVYRGFLRKTNTYIAVKRVSSGSKQGVKEYASEVKIISQLRHRNLVQILGWCHKKGELLLAYEFMPNGSLDSHLFKGRSLLSSETRYRIAQGLASALLYLHEEWERCVIHRDIKSSNIMLDSSFNAKLGDFGLARLVDHEKGSQTTVLAGNRGYMAPECITGKASKESDVYSFGIVALEIACGRKPIDFGAKENQIILVEWVWDLYGMGRLIEAVDPKLGADFDVEQMQHLMIVGLWCAHPDSSSRPSIMQAIHVLNSEAQLPILPSKMPVPTYSTPVMSAYSSVSQSHDHNLQENIAQESSISCSNIGSSSSVLFTA